MSTDSYYQFLNTYHEIGWRRAGKIHFSGPGLQKSLAVYADLEINCSLFTEKEGGKKS